MDYIGARATACFGAPGGFVTKGMILQSKHAVARFPPPLETPNMMLVFMDIIQQEVIREPWREEGGRQKFRST